MVVSHSCGHEAKYEPLTMPKCGSSDVSKQLLTMNLSTMELNRISMSLRRGALRRSSGRSLVVPNILEIPGMREPMLAWREPLCGVPRNTCTCGDDYQRTDLSTRHRYKCPGKLCMREGTATHNSCCRVQDRGISRVGGVTSDAQGLG
jgi:hypothetical protein